MLMCYHYHHHHHHIIIIDATTFTIIIIITNIIIIIINIIISLSPAYDLSPLMLKRCTITRFRSDFSLQHVQRATVWRWLFFAQLRQPTFMVVVSIHIWLNQTELNLNQKWCSDVFSTRIRLRSVSTWNYIMWALAFRLLRVKLSKTVSDM